MAKTDPPLAVPPHRVRAFVNRLHKGYQRYHADDPALADPARIYIPVQCHPLPEGEFTPLDALQWIQDGLAKREGQLLLADYGMGKSFVALRLLLDAAEQYDEHPEEGLIPVLFPLRRHRLVQSEPSAILDDLYEFVVARGFPITARVHIENLIRQGRLLLILDGLDEIPLVQTMDPLKVVARLDMAQFGKSPWVITSRRGLFARVLRARPEALRGYRVARLVNWDDVQWHRYVESCDHELNVFNSEILPADPMTRHRRRDRFLEVVSQCPSLRQLAVTPLYARMLVETWRLVVEHPEEMSIVQLYQTYSDVVLCSRQDQHPGVDLDARRQCLESLAAHFFKTKATSCSDQELLHIADGYIRQVGREELLSFVSTGLQTYSLLNCDMLGQLAFSHESFYGYFLALAILREAKNGGWLATPSLLDQRLQTAVGADSHSRGDTSQAVEATFLAQLLAQAENVSLSREMRTLLSSGGVLRARKELKRNLVTIALACRWSLANHDLSDADLCGLDFTQSDLRGARLVNIDAPGADFTGADMTGCVLARAALDGCSLAGTVLHNANLQGATISHIEQSPVTPRLGGAKLKRLTLRREDRAYLLLAVERDGDETWRSQARRDLDGATVID